MNVRLTALAVLVAAAAVAADGDGPFHITTKRKDDRVAVLSEKDKTIFDVHSPFGISQAVIERRGEKWPTAAALRLHLGALEGFSLSNGAVTLGASAYRDGPIRVFKMDKDETPIDEKSPLWPGLHYVRGESGNDGCFEITLPKAFFADNPKSVTVDWVDYYRR